MRFRGIAAMGDFWKVVREFNPEGIEREATAPIDLCVIGEAESGKRSLVNALLGPSNNDNLGPFEIVELDSTPTRWAHINGSDLIVLVVRLDQDLQETGRRLSQLFGRVKTPIILVFTHADQIPDTRDLRNAAFKAFSFVSHLRMAFVDATDATDVQQKLVPMLLETIPDFRTSLARKVPAARRIVADQIVAETCRVNAQFAFAANLPANIPFFGSVAGSVADFFVLTKNQVMMVLRLAAIYGRDISPTLQVAAEMSPVIGGGLVWRTAARLAVGLLPTFLAVAPKMTIAYVGTYIAGEAARYYYEQGQKPPKQLLESFGAEGARLYRHMISRGSGE
ncbi:MAG: hypothetical protein ACOX87_00860 [Chloroflexota bacterium]|jgi:uncharacterized protein (DUF697 family)